jgi:hypothetical protein
VPLHEGIDTANEYGHHRINAPAASRLVYGQDEVDLGDVRQLVEPAQTLAVGLAVERLVGRLDGQTSLRAAIDRLIAEVEEHGLEVLDPGRRGGLASFRSFELAAVLNRFRSLQVADDR